MTYDVKDPQQLGFLQEEHARYEEILGLLMPESYDADEAFPAIVERWWADGAPSNQSAVTWPRLSPYGDMAVRDCDGDVWVRSEHDGRWRLKRNIDAGVATSGGASFDEVLEFGPVTEVHDHG